MTSVEGITGSGINLNSVTGADGGSNTALVAFAASDTDGDVLKISDIGFVSTTTTTQDANLSFSFTVVDADGDATATQVLDVTIEGSSTFTGTADAEAIQGSAGNDTINTGAGNDTLIGGLGNDTLTGGAGSDTFKWSLNETGADRITDFNLAPVANGGDVLDLKDLLTNEHSGGVTNLSQYLHFGIDGGKVVLSIDHDGTGTFTADQTIKLDNYSSLSTLQADLGAASTSDADIIAKMIANGNLKTDV
jgi:Ca2+-binding RTX toxin-like protein